MSLSDLEKKCFNCLLPGGTALCCSGCLDVTYCCWDCAFKSKKAHAKECHGYMTMPVEPKVMEEKKNLFKRICKEHDVEYCDDLLKEYLKYNGEKRRTTSWHLHESRYVTMKQFVETVKSRQPKPTTPLVEEVNQASPCPAAVAAEVCVAPPCAEVATEVCVAPNLTLGEVVRLLTTLISANPALAALPLTF